MKRHILIPTDFSKNALMALAYAIELYKNDQCVFYVLNVFSPTGNIMEGLMNMDPGSELYETAKLESETELAKFLDLIVIRTNPNNKHQFETISTFNHTIEGIKSVLDQKDIELIVMGTKGKTGSTSMAFGSTAINVMEKVRNCPVLVVPENATHQMPREIVFPTGYKLPLKRSQLKFLVDIAKRTGAAIRILHVKEEDELTKKQIENQNILKDTFTGITHTFHILSHTDTNTAIYCFVQSRESDMIAFINKKHSFFGSILTQPLVKEITFNSTVPILVMHDLRN